MSSTSSRSSSSSSSDHRGTSRSDASHFPPPPEQIEAMNKAGRRIQELAETLEAMPDPATRALLQECMSSLLGFYGQGLERVVALAADLPDGFHARFVNDPVIRPLLLIHGLHPLDLQTRLRQALDKVRPYMESHGGSVELLEMDADYARLRLVGSCGSCASSATTLELAVRQAIEEHCPDLAGFDVEGMAEFAAQAAHAPSGWVPIPAAADLPEGAMIQVHADDLPLVVCRARGQLYAYRDRCTVCNVPLHLGTLSGDLLSCRAGHRFDVCAAGRSLDDPHAHLDPLPLLSENGSVKVARAAP